MIEEKQRRLREMGTCVIGSCESFQGELYMPFRNTHKWVSFISVKVWFDVIHIGSNVNCLTDSIDKSMNTRYILVNCSRRIFCRKRL